MPRLKNSRLVSRKSKENIISDWDYPRGFVREAEFDSETQELNLLSFIIKGRPIVKKNNQKVVRLRGGGYKKINTTAYNNWLNSAESQLNDVKKIISRMTTSGKFPTINFRVNMEARFFMPTFGVVDLSALYEGIQDLMKTSGVIEDDNGWVLVSHDGSGITKDANLPRMEIILTRKELRSWQIAKN